MRIFQRHVEIQEATSGLAWLQVNTLSLSPTGIGVVRLICENTY